MTIQDRWKQLTERFVKAHYYLVGWYKDGIRDIEVVVSGTKYHNGVYEVRFKNDDPKSWNIEMRSPFNGSFAYYRALRSFNPQQLGFRRKTMANWTTKQFVLSHPDTTKLWATDKPFQVLHNGYWLDVVFRDNSVPGYGYVLPKSIRLSGLIENIETAKFRARPTLDDIRFSHGTQVASWMSNKSDVEVQIGGVWHKVSYQEGDCVINYAPLADQVSIFCIPFQSMFFRQIQRERPLNTGEMQELVNSQDTICIREEACVPVAVGTMSFVEDVFYIGGVLPIGGYDQAAKLLFDSGYLQGGGRIRK